MHNSFICLLHCQLTCPVVHPKTAFVIRKFNFSLKAKEEIHKANPFMNECVYVRQDQGEASSVNVYVCVPQFVVLWQCCGPTVALVNSEGETLWGPKPNGSSHSWTLPPHRPDKSFSRLIHYQGYIQNIRPEKLNFSEQIHIFIHNGNRTSVCVKLRIQDKTCKTRN